MSLDEALVGAKLMEVELLLVLVLVLFPVSGALMLVEGTAILGGAATTGCMCR